MEVDIKWKFDTVMVFATVWYKGCLLTFNCSTGKWTVKFYNDDETTEAYFPDRDVQVVNK